MSDNAPARNLSHVPFWYLRHGETDWNVQNLAQGQTEVPLNARGVKQAAIAADALVGRGIVTIISSPLSRARATAEAVAAKLGLPVQIEAELLECAYGEKDGLPMEGWFPDWVSGAFTPPGGESFTQLRERATRAVNRCLQLPGPVLIVAHGALMRALRAEMNQTAQVRTANATPMHCQIPAAGEHIWTITNLPVAEVPAAS